MARFFFFLLCFKFELGCLAIRPTAPCVTERARRNARVRAAKKPKGAALVGDVAWRDTSSALDVDEARMQRFLDADPRRRENFSVQDMLDGRLSAEDPLGDLISD